MPASGPAAAVAAAAAAAAARKRHTHLPTRVARHGRLLALRVVLPAAAVVGLLMLIHTYQLGRSQPQNYLLSKAQLAARGLGSLYRSRAAVETSSSKCVGFGTDTDTAFSRPAYRGTACAQGVWQSSVRRKLAVDSRAPQQLATGQVPLEGHVAELDVVVKTFADAEGCAAHTRDFWTQHVRHVPLDAYANITAGGPDLPATSDLHILLWNPATMLHKAHVPPPAQRTWQFSAKQIVMAFRVDTAFVRIAVTGHPLQLAEAITADYVASIAKDTISNIRENTASKPTQRLRTAVDAMADALALCGNAFVAPLTHLPSYWLLSSPAENDSAAINDLSRRILVMLASTIATFLIGMATLPLWHRRGRNALRAAMAQLAPSASRLWAVRADSSSSKSQVTATAVVSEPVGPRRRRQQRHAEAGGEASARSAPFIAQRGLAVGKTIEEPPQAQQAQHEQTQQQQPQQELHQPQQQKKKRQPQAKTDAPAAKSRQHVDRAEPAPANSKPASPLPSSDGKESQAAHGTPAEWQAVQRSTRRGPRSDESRSPIDTEAPFAVAPPAAAPAKPPTSRKAPKSQPAGSAALPTLTTTTTTSTATASHCTTAASVSLASSITSTRNPSTVSTPPSSPARHGSIHRSDEQSRPHQPPHASSVPAVAPDNMAISSSDSTNDNVPRRRTLSATAPEFVPSCQTSSSPAAPISYAAATAAGQQPPVVAQVREQHDTALPASDMAPSSNGKLSATLPQRSLSRRLRRRRLLHEKQMTSLGFPPPLPPVGPVPAMTLPSPGMMTLPSPGMMPPPPTAAYMVMGYDGRAGYYTLLPDGTYMPWVPMMDNGPLPPPTPLNTAAWAPTPVHESPFFFSINPAAMPPYAGLEWVPQAAAGIVPPPPAVIPPYMYPYATVDEAHDADGENGGESEREDVEEQEEDGMVEAEKDAHNGRRCAARASSAGTAGARAATTAEVETETDSGVDERSSGTPAGISVP